MGVRGNDSNHDEVVGAEDELGERDEEHADVGGLRRTAQGGDKCADCPAHGLEKSQLAVAEEVEGVLVATKLRRDEWPVPKGDMTGKVDVCG